jgi:hypothetical protein
VYGGLVVELVGRLPALGQGWYRASIWKVPTEADM